MVGKMYPKCGQYIFFVRPDGRACIKCGYRILLPTNEGKGGRSQKCPNCGKQQVFNNVCRNCGVQFFDK